MGNQTNAEKPTSTSSSIKFRYYQPADGPQVRQLFKTSMSVGVDSPLRSLYRHELKSPRAVASYAIFLLGLALYLTASAQRHPKAIRLFAAALITTGSVSLITHFLFTHAAFMAFVNGSIGGPEMMDIPHCYGLVASADPAQRGALVPLGKNAFWVAEACMSGDSAHTEVVGCVGIDINTSPGDDSAELRRMAVSGKYRGRGIARQLIRALLAHARATGVDRVYLRTSSSNAGAISAYRKLGFEVDQEYVMFKNLDTHVLSLDVRSVPDLPRPSE